MFFAITAIVLVTIYVAPYLFGFFLSKRRDRIFEDLARTYKMEVIYDHKSYTWDYIVPSGKRYFELRTLRGSLRGKSMIIQDRIDSGIALLARLEGWRGLLRGPSSFWIYRISPPFTSMFGWGAQTIVHEDGHERNISSRGFFDVVAFAPKEALEDVIKALA